MRSALGIRWGDKGAAGEDGAAPAAATGRRRWLPTREANEKLRPSLSEFTNEARKQADAITCLKLQKYNRNISTVRMSVGSWFKENKRDLRTATPRRNFRHPVRTCRCPIRTSGECNNAVATADKRPTWETGVKSMRSRGVTPTSAGAHSMRYEVPMATSVIYNEH
ncbi:hypothetical protein EVAR_3827_1 [Eumeta japonica]|uniref:Uncharacterized protein n=1 Tax=Eumeta variegata TaxID=151549 RepID=A0A4C1SQJ7_EUMVA|nr:hypothetical protein EVAR_3827_1 [Eumeta japonica]